MSHGETEIEPNGSSTKIIKERDMSMLTPNQQKSSKNQQKQEKKNLPVEANEKSTINIPENPLQLGWPEISKPSFFFSWPPSQAKRILSLKLKDLPKTESLCKIPPATWKKKNLSLIRSSFFSPLKISPKLSQKAPSPAGDAPPLTDSKRPLHILQQVSPLDSSSKKHCLIP